MNNLEPIGWTVNLISLLWVWIIFFGCAFFVRDREHVVFDILFFAVSKKFQKIFSFIIALFLASIMLYSFGPTWDAVFDNRLMELKKIQTLKMPVTGEKIPIKWLFAPYVILMVAVILRYFWNILSLLFIEKRMERSKIGEDN
jgi:C4-dicarboxylate transporter DctQ subunit|tara:strand:+ start:571 stop:999 length:429 start_codon:yes stop_codon:yes gene_type:complete